MGILEGLSDALAVAHYDNRDQAVIAIAAKLAQEIDASSEPKIIGDLSTRLLTVLTALGLTPQSRASAAKGMTSNGAGPNAANAVIDELRDRRQRANGTANLDATP